MDIYSQADSNVKKTWFYLTTFLILTILIGWFISFLTDTYIVLWIAVIYSFLISFIAYWNSDKVVLKMSGAKAIEKKDNPELYRLVENLCIAGGLPLPKIYIIQDSQPNAFATGRNPQNGVVAVTTGLLERLEKAELEGVIAHELSHIGNRDALMQTIIVVLVGVIVLITDLFLRITLSGSRSKNSGGPIILIAALVLSILAPLAAYILKFAISRKREFLADASAALLTRYPEGLARALEKISQDPRQLKKANDATAHLYIINPFRGQENQSWFKKLFLTHPPTQQRIAILRSKNI
ncbi:MAG: M48 family metallopeptidase [Candidatus Pacebacteria bacterium]|nr:M48 family metallopeptidase [Candidatus Paceibacterota bacterium]